MQILSIQQDAYENNFDLNEEQFMDPLIIKKSLSTNEFPYKQLINAELSFCLPHKLEQKIKIQNISLRPLVIKLFISDKDVFWIVKPQYKNKQQFILLEAFQQIQIHLIWNVFAMKTINLSNKQQSNQNGHKLRIYYCEISLSQQLNNRQSQQLNNRQSQINYLSLQSYQQNQNNLNQLSQSMFSQSNLWKLKYKDIKIKLNIDQLQGISLVNKKRSIQYEKDSPILRKNLQKPTNLTNYSSYYLLQNIVYQNNPYLLNRSLQKTNKKQSVKQLQQLEQKLFSYLQNEVVNKIMRHNDDKSIIKHIDDNKINNQQVKLTIKSIDRVKGLLNQQDRFIVQIQYTVLSKDVYILNQHMYTHKLNSQILCQFIQLSIDNNLYIYKLRKINDNFYSNLKVKNLPEIIEINSIKEDSKSNRKNSLNIIQKQLVYKQKREIQISIQNIILNKQNKDKKVQQISQKQFFRKPYSQKIQLKKQALSTQQKVEIKIKDNEFEYYKVFNKRQQSNIILNKRKQQIINYKQNNLLQQETQKLQQITQILQQKSQRLQLKSHKLQQLNKQTKDDLNIQKQDTSRLKQNKIIQQSQQTQKQIQQTQNHKQAKQQTDLQISLLKQQYKKITEHKLNSQQEQPKYISQSISFNVAQEQQNDLKFKQQQLLKQPFSAVYNIQDYDQIKYQEIVETQVHEEFHNQIQSRKQFQSNRIGYDFTLLEQQQKSKSLKSSFFSLQAPVSQPSHFTYKQSTISPSKQILGCLVYESISSTTIYLIFYDSLMFFTLGLQSYPIKKTILPLSDPLSMDSVKLRTPAVYNKTANQIIFANNCYLYYVNLNNGQNDWKYVQRKQIYDIQIVDDLNLVFVGGKNFSKFSYFGKQTHRTNLKVYSTGKKDKAHLFTYDLPEIEHDNGSCTNAGNVQQIKWITTAPSNTKLLLVYTSSSNYNHIFFLRVHAFNNIQLYSHYQLKDIGLHKIISIKYNSITCKLLILQSINLQNSSVKRIKLKAMYEKVEVLTECVKMKQGKYKSIQAGGNKTLGQWYSLVQQCGIQAWIYRMGHSNHQIVQVQSIQSVPDQIIQNIWDVYNGKYILIKGQNWLKIKQRVNNI